jgi:hypothetical protein
VAVNPVGTEGGVISAVEGRVIVTFAVLDKDTLPARSLAHAYRVFVPWVAKVYEVGALDVHPAVVEAGAVDDSVSMYPVTPTLSEAVNTIPVIVREDEVDGIVKVPITGLVVSVEITLLVKTALAVMFPLIVNVHVKAVVQPDTPDH